TSAIYPGSFPLKRGTISFRDLRSPPPNRCSTEYRCRCLPRKLRFALLSLGSAPHDPPHPPRRLRLVLQRLGRRLLPSRPAHRGSSVFHHLPTVFPLPFGHGNVGRIPPNWSCLGVLFKRIVTVGRVEWATLRLPRARGQRSLRIGWRLIEWTGKCERCSTWGE